VDTMTIKDLGRWESLGMVQQYTRLVAFEDSMDHYEAPCRKRGRRNEPVLSTPSHAERSSCATSRQ
jgi:hypothetical protein